MASELSTKKAPWIFALPVALAAGLIPLIVKQKMIPVHTTVAGIWPHGDIDADFFSYYKNAALIIFASLAVIMLLWGFLSHKIKPKPVIIYIPLIVFLLFALLSTVFSEYKHIAYFGFAGRYEGIFIILAYMVLLFVSLHVFNDETSIRLLLACLIVSSTLICLIGIFQFCGLDLFKTSMVQKLIMSGEAVGALNIRSDNYAGTPYENAIYATLFNSNTFGMYISMLFPFSFVLTMTAKKKLHIVASAAYSCLMFAGLLGSYSRGAYAAAAVGVLFGLILLYFKHRARWKRVLTVFSFFIVVFVLMSFQSGGALNKRFVSFFSTIKEESIRPELDKVRNFETEGRTLTLYSEFSKLRIKASDNKVSFFDDEDNPLELRPAENNDLHTFTNKKYDSYFIQVSGNIINIVKDKSFLLFAVIDDEFVPLDSHGRVVDVLPIESFGFKGLERFASARGYIWSRSIPLIKHTLFLGHGPDTFAIYFPQDDYLGKLNFMYDANILIDKPHSIFLQTAINTGVISLISLICLLAYFFMSCIGTVKNKRITYHRFTYVMLINAAIPGYLVAGMFSDSSVSAAPVFWVLLGASICINRAALVDNGTDEEINLDT